MKSKIRHLLCKDCKRIIGEYEKEYAKENKDTIKQNRRKHYLEVELKGKKPKKKFDIVLTNEEKTNIQGLKNIIDRMPEESIY